MSDVRFVRLLHFVRLVYGSTLLIAPDALLPQGADRRVRAVGRILGARQLLQAALVSHGSSRRRLYVGAIVDGSHAATMAAYAAVCARHRRLACWNAVTALGFAAAGLAIARQKGRLGLPATAVSTEAGVGQSGAQAR